MFFGKVVNNTTNKNTISNLELSTKDIGNTIVLYCQGYDRVRDDTKKIYPKYIYITKEEFLNQQRPDIDNHHPAVLPTLSSLKNDLFRAKTSNKVWCPHDPNKPVGYIIDIHVSKDNAINNDKYGEYLSLYYDTRIYKDKIPYILKYLNLQNKLSDGNELRIYNNIIQNENGKRSLTNEELSHAKQFIFTYGEFSIGYRYKVNNMEDKVYLDDFKLDHIAIVQNARYKKSLTMFINEKKNNNTQKIKKNYNNNIIIMTTKEEKEKKKKDNDIKMTDKNEMKNQTVKKTDPNGFDSEKISFALGTIDINIDEEKLQQIKNDKTLSKILTDIGDKLINEKKKKWDKNEKEFNVEFKSLGTVYKTINTKDIDNDLKKELKYIKFTDELNNAWKYILNTNKKLEENIQKKKDDLEMQNRKRKQDDKVMSNQKKMSQNDEDNLMNTQDKKRRISKKSESNQIMNTKKNNLNYKKLRDVMRNSLLKVRTNTDLFYRGLNHPDQ
jgi:hypothetical protein